MTKVVIQIGERNFVLLFDEFDDDMDIDSLLKIDYSNLIGELITFPVIVNRFGQLLSEADSQVAEAKLNLDIHEAKQKEKLRVELTDKNGKAPTVDALNNAFIATKSYRVMRLKFIEAQKTKDYINSIYWSAKDKSGKLDKLSLSFQVGDLEDSVIEGRVNNVLIKRREKLID